MAQKVEITAGNQRPAPFQELADGIAKRRGFPVFFGDAMHPENRGGNLTLAGTMPARICGTQHDLDPPSLLPGDAPVRRNLIAVEATKDAIQCCNAIEPLTTERDQDGQGMIGCRARIKDELNPWFRVGPKGAMRVRRQGAVTRQKLGQCYRVYA